MSAVRFYLDADSVDASLVRHLRTHGLDVQTALEVGLRTASDDEQIAHVLASGRVLITGDFRLCGRLADLTRQGGHHPGVLVLPARQRKQIGDVVFSVRLVSTCCSAEEMTDRIEFIPY